MKYKTITIWALLLIGLVALLSFAEARHTSKICSKLRVNVLGTDKQQFISYRDVEELVLNQGDSILNQPISSIALQRIEERLESRAAVKNAEVYLSLNGALHVRVEQRTPLVRVINKRGESGYLDELGYFMPLSEKYAARVLVANGNIEDGLWAFNYEEVAVSDSLRSETVLDEIFELAQFIHERPFWKAQITQVYYNEEGDFELIPRVGAHIIVLGKAEHLEEKFGKLYAFYKKGLPYTDWNAYERINLKFNNQVVCTKK